MQTSDGFIEMTELYTHTHYIWYRVLLRVMVMAPIKITEFIALCISGACEELGIRPDGWNLYPGD